jgi:hypothetical protein
MIYIILLLSLWSILFADLDITRKRLALPEFPMIVRINCLSQAMIGQQAIGLLWLPDLYYWQHPGE